ncbi:MAG: hypothetical protein K6L81_02285 [Agarilytica sp.]
MINFSKINAVKLRAPSDTDKVVGPNFKKSKRYEFTLAGSKLVFLAPDHSPRYDSSVWLTSKKNDALEEPFREFTSGVLAVDSWESASVFSRAWGYYYSKFGGGAGELKMSIGVRKRNSRFVFQSGSFLHPKTFEYTLSLFLTNMFGWKTLSGKASYTAPQEWGVNKTFPVPAASYDIVGSNEERVFVFPVTGEHFVEISFSYIGRANNVRKEMRTLVDQIIDSMSLELSPETQHLVDQISLENAGVELTEHFAPLKWPVSKEDVEKQEKLENDLLS